MKRALANTGMRLYKNNNECGAYASKLCISVRPLSQVVQVHQETVDLYLEDIILGTLEHTSDQQAREEIRRRVKEVNDIAYAMEERYSSVSADAKL